LRIYFPDYQAKTPVKNAKMFRVSNKPFTDSEYNIWRTAQKRSLNLAQDDGASDLMLKPFRKWTKRRVDGRLQSFAKTINHVYKDDSNLDKLIEQRIKKRRFAHNSAYKILDLQNKIAAAKHEIQDLHEAHEQDLWNGFRENLEMEDYSIEKEDRDWVAEKAKWMPLSMEAKSSKRGISQALIDSYSTKVEEKQRFITQMQKILNATKTQKSKEKRESRKINKEETGINILTKQKLRLMRRLQQRRYLTSARQIKREEANNRFRRYETRPTMLWATKKTVKKDKGDDKAASAAGTAKAASLSKLDMSSQIRKRGRKRKLKSPKEMKKIKRKKKKKKKKMKKRKDLLSKGMSLNEWRIRTEMRHHATIQT